MTFTPINKREWKSTTLPVATIKHYTDSGRFVVSVDGYNGRDGWAMTFHDASRIAIDMVRGMK